MHCALVRVNRNKQKRKQKLDKEEGNVGEVFQLGCNARVGKEPRGCLKVIMTTGGIVNSL
jgi:hypothetical protein